MQWQWGLVAYLCTVVLFCWMWYRFHKVIGRDPSEGSMILLTQTGRWTIPRDGRYSFDLARKVFVTMDLKEGTKIFGCGSIHIDTDRTIIVAKNYGNASMKYDGCNIMLHQKLKRDHPSVGSRPTVLDDHDDMVVASAYAWRNYGKPLNPDYTLARDHIEVPEVEKHDWKTRVQKHPPFNFMCTSICSKCSKVGIAESEEECTGQKLNGKSPRFVIFDDPIVWPKDE